MSNSYRVSFVLNTWASALPDFPDPLTFLRWLLTEDTSKDKELTNIEVVRLSDWAQGFNAVRISHDRLSIGILIERLQALGPDSKIIGYSGLTIETDAGTVYLVGLKGDETAPPGELGLLVLRPEGEGFVPA